LSNPRYKERKKGKKERKKGMKDKKNKEGSYLWALDRLGNLLSSTGFFFVGS
jgi:hypothetical protein